MGPRARRRRWPLWLLLAAALAGGAVLAMRALLQPERLGALLLRQAEASTGLALETASPARLGIWPDLHLELEGLVARSAPGDVPLLRVGQVEAVLPWSVLSAPQVSLRSLRLQSPMLDLAALEDWRRTRADAGPPAPIELPQFDGSLQVEDGRVLGDGWRIEDVAVSLPHWRAGESTRLALHASLRWADEETAWQFELDAGVVAATRPDPLRLEPTKLGVHAPGAKSAMVLEGSAAYSATRLQLALQGDLDPWPEAWPQPPLPEPDGEALRLHLESDTTLDLRGDIRLWLARGDARIEARLQPGDIAGWRSGGDAWLPPLRGGVEANRLQLGGATLHGVKIRIEDGQDAEEDARD